MTATILGPVLDLRQPATSADSTFPVAYPAVRADVLVETDLSLLVELLSDPTIAWYEPLAVPLSDPHGVQLVRTFLRKAGDPTSSTRGWAVVEAGIRVGVCQLRREGDGFLVGVSLFAWARSRGLGAALFSALARHGMENLGASHVAGEVEDDNIASIRALHKAAYVPGDRYPKTLDDGRQTMVTRFVAPG